jgi:hypothetical protein
MDAVIGIERTAPMSPLREANGRHAARTGAGAVWVDSEPVCPAWAAPHQTAIHRTSTKPTAPASEPQPDCVVTRMNTSLGKAARWRKRAEECRTLAEIVKTPTVQKDYIDIARAYDTLADSAEQLDTPRYTSNAADL